MACRPCIGTACCAAVCNPKHAFFVYSVAAPLGTLELLVTTLGLGAIVLLPSLIYLFIVFKQQNHPQHA